MDYRICYSTDLITYKLIKIYKLQTDMDYICKYWTNKAGWIEKHEHYREHVPTHTLQAPLISMKNSF
jgi:hypothetical protein